MKMKKVTSEGQDQFRVVITKEANSGLEEAVINVNKGFESGLVARSDIANYVFLNLTRLLTEADLKALRAQYFDAKKVMSTLLRSSEDLPEEVQKALRIACGIAESPKRRST